MSRTKIVWAEVHAPLFLNGTNLGQKLDHTVKGGVTLEYCEDKRHLYVTYQGKTLRVPETSVLGMVEADPTPAEKFSAQVSAAHRGKPIEAQAESPQSHVFGGPGAGQTGQEEPRKTAMQEAFEKGQVK